MRSLLLLPLLAWSLCAADVAGTWSGMVQVADPSNGQPVEANVKAVFEQKGDAVSVKIYRRGAEAEAAGEGKLQGNILTFAVKPHEGGSAFQFRLTLAADKLEGTVEGALDTGKIRGKVTLTRQP